MNVCRALQYTEIASASGRAIIYITKVAVALITTIPPGRNRSCVMKIPTHVKNPLVILHAMMESTVMV